MREKEASPNLPAFIYFTLISSSYSKRRKLDRKALSTAAFLLLYIKVPFKGSISDRGGFYDFTASSTAPRLPLVTIAAYLAK